MEDWRKFRQTSAKFLPDCHGRSLAEVWQRSLAEVWQKFHHVSALQTFNPRGAETTGAQGPRLHPNCRELHPKLQAPMPWGPKLQAHDAMEPQVETPVVVEHQVEAPDAMRTHLQAPEAMEPQVEAPHAGEKGRAQ